MASCGTPLELTLTKEKVKDIFGDKKKTPTAKQADQLPEIQPAKNLLPMDYNIKTFRYYQQSEPRSYS